MTVFDDLLQVQEHDTAADRLRHRRLTLPELVELQAAEDELARVEAAAADVDARAAEAGRAQRHLEGELSLVEAKVAELEAKLYSGAINVPRELQAMQAEGEALRARRATLEDEVLEAMGRRESLDAEAVALQKRREELDADGSRLRVAVAEAQAQVDRDLAAELDARASAAAGIPAELASLYEQLRVRLGGVAAAPLVNGRCGGCHLALPATEVARLRREPPETLVRCEQCERILVRP
ncbi:MAG TPA: C4-type zinc ribbon domain-containing protein [Acidimicrobiales bacterium]|nr:C4-type zinc ribbon domain-containing protein [Acidimicrobiales bacterium]